MKYDSYEDYVEDAKLYYTHVKINPDLMILPKKLFFILNGIIEFGPGSKNLVNSKCNCNCKIKCENHKERE